MLFSVIIPTCNRVEQLDKCLALLKSDIRPINSELYEVIVSDDSKDDSTMVLIQQKYGRVKYLNGPKRGPAANRNNGAKQANGEWLVFIDDDCLPCANLLMSYEKAIGDNPCCGAFEGAILPDDWEMLKKDLTECPVNSNGGCFWSANICIQKTLFEQIRGFNEKFLIAAQEDQEIYSRILQHTRVPFCEDCIVIHPVRYKKLEEKIKRIPVEIKNWILFARMKHSWSRIFFDGAVSQIKACIRTIQQNKFRMVIYHLLSLAYLFPGIILSALQKNGKQKI